jgi:hypothetical protein
MFDVNLRRYFFEDWLFTFNLASGITSADVGKALSRDTSAANTLKLAADDDDIVGRLEQVEDRAQEGQLVGAVSIKFLNSLPIAAAQTINVGDKIVGAGNGEVKAKATPAGWERVEANEVDAANSLVYVQAL